MPKLYTANWCVKCGAVKRNLDLTKYKVIQIDEMSDSEIANLGIKQIPTIELDTGERIYVGDWSKEKLNKLPQEP